MTEEHGIKTTNCQTGLGTSIFKREAGESIDEFEYDADGSASGVIVTFRGARYPVHATRDGMHVPGLPVISRLRDAAGRLRAVQANGRVLLEYRRDGSGRISGLRVGNDFDFSLSDDGVHSWASLRSSDGRLLHESIADGGYAVRAPEPVRLELLQDVELPRPLIVKRNATSSLNAVIGNDGTPRYVSVVFGPDRVIFDGAGRAVLYDLDLLGEVDEGPSSATLFSRLLVTANGDYEVMAPFAPRGNVLACGARQDREHGRSTFVETLAAQSSSRTGSITSNTYLCDVSTVCMTWTGGGSSCSTTYYYCDGGGDSGCLDCSTGGGSTGDGTTSSHPNDHIANSFLKSKVNAALDGALTKLLAANCQNVFSQFKAADGRTLSQILTSLNTDPYEYMSLYIQFYDGSNESACVNSSDTIAFTAPGSRAVYICSRFTQLAGSVAENRMIHEELHSVGLGENPPSDATIDGAVQNGCGN